MTMDLFEDDEGYAPPVADMSDHPLVRGLNPEQAAAVQHVHGPMLVLAGAGSGKTRVITHRIAFLVQEHNVRPWQVLAVTFSNKAAGEMRHRLEDLLGESAKDLWLGTFHSIGVRMLRQIGEFAGVGRNFTIYDRDDQLKMLTRVMRQLNLSDKIHPPRKIAAWIDRAKNRCLLPGDPALPSIEVADRVAAKVYAAYEDEMRRAGSVDFGDLLMRPVQILAANEALRIHWSQRFKQILVDEFQDTNGAQYQLLELLASTHHNLTVVGDDDQSIYSWRGAEIQNILGFPEAHPGAKVVRLERNYRSTDVILATSGAIVRQNRLRHDKTLWTEQVGGEKVVLFAAQSDRDEADWVAKQIEQQRNQGVKLAEIAVFYRTNAQSRLLEESMSRFRLPYIVVGGLRFYERAEIKDLLAYCRLLVNPDDTASWLRVVNTPARGIGDRTVELVEDHARATGLSLPKAAEDMVRRGDGGRARDKLAGFVGLIDKMRDAIAGCTADAAGNIVLRDSGLRDAWLADGSDEAKTRVENLGEMVSAMAEYAEGAEDQSLQGFLETVALVADIDALKAGGAFLSLMTMHAAKGLEFDVTFVTGLEENLVPHNNADVDEDEERRLLYVGMTRARKRMFLSYARSRMRFGTLAQSDPSPFLMGLPREHVIETGTVDVGARSGGYGGYGGASGFGGASSFGGRSSFGQQRPGSSFGGRSALGGIRLGDRNALVARQQRDDGTTIVRDVPPPSASDEPVFEREASGGFEVGGRAAHAAFGVGEVLEVSGYGPAARVSVRFPRAGLKKVLARFLKPA